jgi:hypothetical protein
MTAGATVDALLSAAAEGLGGVMTERSGGTTTWSNGDRVFAVATADVVELRLDATVAAAAVRTPDTATSSLGPEWVRFSPPALDGHAVDRLEAWFALAWRRATGAAERSG